MHGNQVSQIRLVGMRNILDTNAEQEIGHAFVKIVHESLLHNGIVIRPIHVWVFCHDTGPKRKRGSALAYAGDIPRLRFGPVQYLYILIGNVLINHR